MTVGGAPPGEIYYSGPFILIQSGGGGGAACLAESACSLLIARRSEGEQAIFLREALNKCSEESQPEDTR